MKRKISLFVLYFLICNFVVAVSLSPQTKLGKLKNSYTVLKRNCGQGQLSNNLANVMNLLATPFVKKDIVIDGKKYCECEFWKVSALAASVKDKSVMDNTPAFNVISDANLNVANFMKDPENNGAVFQIAANDDLPWTWTSGGVQAGAVVDATKFGNFIRKVKNFNPSGLNAFFDSPLLHHNKDGRVSLGTTSDLACNKNNGFIAIHSGLSVQGVPGQVVHVPFVAAYAASDNNYDVKSKTENCVKNCLEVAYDGTLLAAVHLGAPKVFLTLMGVGVFNNKIDDAIAAIDSAVMKYVKSYGLNVTVLYRDSDRAVIKKLQAIANKIK